MEADLYPASCLCGTVRLEVAGPPSEILHCHCRSCQKAHGASFATFARFPLAGFRVTAGEDHIAGYRSSEAVQRAFCDVCGSTLQFVRDGAETFGLAVAALDRPLEPQPVAEYHVESKVDWLARSESAGR